MFSKIPSGVEPVKYIENVVLMSAKYSSGLQKFVKINLSNLSFVMIVYAFFNGSHGGWC